MKYLLLAYGAENAWTESERTACMRESVELCHQLAKQGQYLAAAPLDSVTVATSVRVREGKRLITDGPFAETHEQLGGYFLIDAASLDDAIDIAARIPSAAKGTIEVRPIIELDDLPTIAAKRL